jgi:transcription elongation factor Elf1
MLELNGMRRFPCPVCFDPREVRMTKKKKPYVTCDPCGIQVFVRGPAGISAFNRLVDDADQTDLWNSLHELEKRYRLKCSNCGHKFWAAQELVKTSWLDGSILGFSCPECDANVEWEKRP